MVAEHDVFDRVAVINLDRRSDRLDRFNDGISKLDWPFRCPVRFAAIDGWKLPLPDGWGDGMQGAHGCSLSHRRVLEQAILDDVSSILIMEDDCIFRPSFPDEFSKFYDHVPTDWDFLFLGSDCHDRTTAINEYVHRVQWGNRWHCYAVRGRLIKDLYRHLNSTTGHCDLVTWPFLNDYNVYCPPKPLAAQDEYWSDIASRNEIRRWWTKPDESAPVVYFRGPREVVEELYNRRLLHGGYKRNPDTGVDLWLEQLIAKHGTTGRPIEESARGFVAGIKGEATGEGGMLACLYAPTLQPATCRRIIGKNIVEIDADTLQGAMEQLSKTSFALEK